MRNYEIARELLKFDEAVRKLRQLAMVVSTALLEKRLPEYSDTTDGYAVTNRVSITNKEDHQPATVWFRWYQGKEVYRIGPIQPTFEVRPVFEFVSEISRCPAVFEKLAVDHASIRQFLHEFWDVTRDIVQSAHYVGDDLSRGFDDVQNPQLPPGCYKMTGPWVYYNNGMTSFVYEDHKHFSDDRGCSDYRFAADFLREYLQHCVTEGFNY